VTRNNFSLKILKAPQKLMRGFFTLKGPAKNGRAIEEKKPAYSLCMKLRGIKTIL
jgi:hypothetical protein